MVDTPFVSEDFQRAYRNQFPSQVSSGRDLHVSDVVIPVVDFTPTASGASLPLNLRTAINPATNLVTYNTQQTGTTFIDASGFFEIFYNIGFLPTATTSYLELILFDKGASTSTTVYKRNFFGLAAGLISNDRLEFFIPANFSLRLTLDVTVGVSELNIASFQVADVNGNLTNPSGYDPQ